MMDISSSMPARPAEIAKEASVETRVRGYRVKVNYSPVPSDEAKHIENSIVKTVSEATRKKRNAE